MKKNINVTFYNANGPKLLSFISVTLFYHYGLFSDSRSAVGKSQNEVRNMVLPSILLFHRLIQGVFLNQTSDYGFIFMTFW